MIKIRFLTLTIIVITHFSCGPQRLKQIISDDADLVADTDSQNNPSVGQVNSGTPQGPTIPDPDFEAQDEYYVSQGSSGDGTIEDPYGSISRALNVAQDKSTIYVAAGVYDEVIEINNSIQIIGGFDNDFEEKSVGSTVIRASEGDIDGERSLVGVKISNVNDSVVLNNLKIDLSEVAQSITKNNYGINIIDSIGVKIVYVDVNSGNSLGSSIGVNVESSIAEISNSNIETRTSNMSYGIKTSGNTNLKASNNNIISRNGTVKTFGIYSQGEKEVYNSNKIKFGSSPQNCVGVEVASINASELVFSNNVIINQACKKESVALLLNPNETSSGNKSFFNNTLIVNSGMSESENIGIKIQKIGDNFVKIQNNIIDLNSGVTRSTCILIDQDSEVPNVFSHNVFSDCNARLNAEGVNQNNISDIERVFSVTSDQLLFKRISLDVNGVIDPSEIDEFLIRGGLNGSNEGWDFKNDFNGKIRPEQMTVGWTIGAYQVD